MIKGVDGFEPSFTQALIGNDVVSFVGVLADFGIFDMEFREVIFDFSSEFAFGEIGLVEPGVVGTAFHSVEVLDAVQESAGSAGFHCSCRKWPDSCTSGRGVPGLGGSGAHRPAAWAGGAGFLPLAG